MPYCIAAERTATGNMRSNALNGILSIVFFNNILHICQNYYRMIVLRFGVYLVKGGFVNSDFYPILSNTLFEYFAK